MIEFKTILAFSKHTVSCMAYFYKDSWSAPPDKVDSPFHHVMGEAIIRFTLYHREWLNSVAEEVVYDVDEDPDEFFEFGYELADQLFENEPFMELIAICSFITYIAHVLFIMGKRQFMDKAYFMIAILFLKLRNRFEANGGWREFQRLCLEYSLMIIKKGKIKQRHSTGKVPQSSEAYEKSSDTQNLTRFSKLSTFGRSKSADSIQITGSIRDIPKSPSVIAKSTGASPKSTRVVSKSAGAIEKSTGATSKSTRVVSKSIGTMPKSTGAVPKSIRFSQISTEASPKSTGVVSKSTGAIPKSTGAIPKSKSGILKSAGTVTKSTGTIQKSVGTVPKSTGTIQKSAGTVPKSTGTIQKSTEAISKSTCTVPKPADSISKSTSTVPKSADFISKPSDVSDAPVGPTPKSKGLISRTSDAASKLTIQTKSKPDSCRQKTSPAVQPDLVLVTAHLTNKDRKKARRKSNKKARDSAKATNKSPEPSTTSQ